jgi:hypothetical protein
MSEPVRFIFFCSEADYPKFLAILPGNFPPTYREFVANVNQRIKDRKEQITLEKTNVSFDEFIAFCRERGKEPDYDLLVACTFHAWGRK